MAKLYGGRWKSIRPLSSGGQGDVYLVEDRTRAETGELILKRLRNPDRLGRFDRELDALQRLRSTRIPKLVDHSLGNPAFLVYRQVGDETLDHACRRRAIELQDALRIFEQVAEATSDAHGLSIAHRDIKPNNVCVTSDLQQAFLIDFGICQVVDTQLVLTATDEVLGNALFAAPECMPGSGFAPGPHSDVYSLGKLLYWMSSDGQHIHREEISDTVVSKIHHPRELVRYHVSRLLRGTVIADPSRRWTSTGLLKMTAEVRQMIDLLSAQEKVGQFTVWDGFGLNDSFYANSHSSVTKRPRGNPPGDHEFAERFTVPEKWEGELASIAVAIRPFTGRGYLRIALRGDDNGRPSEGSPLEEFFIDVQVPRPVVVKAESMNHPALRAGDNCWLHLSVVEPGAEVAVLTAPESFIPRRSVFAERVNLLPWEVRESGSGPGHAFRILGRTV